MKTSVLYEALRPITRIKPRAGVTKYKMRSHVARDIDDDSNSLDGLPVVHHCDYRSD